jgi:glutathione S-transferase
MKLYYFPGACSLSPHIVLREGGFAFELERVDPRTHTVKATGADFHSVNPKGYVPALVLDDGQLLTEGPAIVQYLADQKPEAGLAPKNGTMERVRLQERLNFIATELHKGFSPLFNPKASEEWKTIVRENLSKRYAYVAEKLTASGQPYLMGERFTVADAYLFTVSAWSKYTGLDLSPWPVLTQYLERVGARPAVHAALEAEGLLK